MFGPHIESGEERGCAIALVVMGGPLNLAGQHRQKRLGSVKRLHLAFLIDAQHDSALGRRQIKPYNIAHFLNEERIG
jgi:hypothetical protein